jgi:ferrous iron transport protein B
LGFGSQLQNFGWVFAVAAITGLIAKENVIATFFTLACCLVTQINVGTIDPSIADSLIQAGEASEDGIFEVVTIINITGVTWPALISFIVFNLTTIPCFAAVATAKAELTKKQFVNTIVFWLVTSFIASSLIYLVLLPIATNNNYWSFIVAGLIVLSIIIFVYAYNALQRRKSDKSWN